MADFCKACSEMTFGSDTKDLANITQATEWAAGRAACVICEGCGHIQVDPSGNCVSEDCMLQGQLGHGMPLVKR